MHYLIIKLPCYNSRVQFLPNFLIVFYWIVTPTLLILHIYSLGLKKHSTTMCSFVLTEALEYYNSNRGSVYCVMLDASKAFDRVQY